MLNIIAGLALLGLAALLIGKIETPSQTRDRKAREAAARQATVKPMEPVPGTAEGKLLQKISDKQDQQGMNQRMLIGALVGVLIARVIYAFL